MIWQANPYQVYNDQLLQIPRLNWSSCQGFAVRTHMEQIYGKELTCQESFQTVTAPVKHNQLMHLQTMVEIARSPDMP